VRTEILGKLVLDRLADRREAAFVDVLDHFHAHLFELCLGLVFELEGCGRLVLADVVGRRLDPFLLFVAQALPDLVADEQRGIVGFVLGERKHRRDFVMLVDEVIVDAVFGHVGDAGL